MITTQQTSYGNYMGQPVLAGTPSYELEDFVVSFTAHMPLLMATSAIGLGRRC